MPPNKELKKMKEREIISNLTLSFGLIAVALLAFSKKVRREIGFRDGWKDVDTGESFFDGFMVHASHYFHDKKRADYDTAENGRMQTVANHLKYHVDHIGNAAKIGLSEASNNKAVEFLKKTPRMTRKWLSKNR